MPIHIGCLMVVLKKQLRVPSHPQGPVCNSAVSWWCATAMHSYSPRFSSKKNTWNTNIRETSESHTFSHIFTINTRQDTSIQFFFVVTYCRPSYIDKSIDIDIEKWYLPKCKTCRRCQNVIFKSVTKNSFMMYYTINKASCYKQD